MQAEIKALERNNTWILIDLLPGQTLIGCKWIYRIKYKAGGSIKRYKTHLVAKEYAQQDGLDYFDTFSPISKKTAVRLILALAAIITYRTLMLIIPFCMGSQ